MPNDRREVQVFALNEQGVPQWKIVRGLAEVKEGELFRMFEPDGAQVMDPMTGALEWIALEDGFLNDDGIGTIMSEDR